MPYFAYLKSNKQLKNFGYQALIEQRADKLIVVYVFEI